MGVRKVDTRRWYPPNSPASSHCKRFLRCRYRRYAIHLRRDDFEIIKQPVSREDNVRKPDDNTNIQLNHTAVQILEPRCWRGRKSSTTKRAFYYLHSS